MKRVIIPIIVVTLAAACAADDSHEDGARIPYFRPAPGWEAVQLGVTATTANIPLEPNTVSGEGPWDTVERLAEGDVLLYAVFWRADEPAVRPGGGFGDSLHDAGKADLPLRELPLSLDDTQPGGLEGLPDDIYAERLAAQVDGWNMDLLIFYWGTDPTGAPPAHTDASETAAAQEQLARLVVPAHV